MLDGGITVLDGEEGVQSQSETVWRQADKYKVPRICFVNKMDKMGADLWTTVTSIEERLGVRTAVMVVPIGRESSYIGNVDLLTRKAEAEKKQQLICAQNASKKNYAHG